MTGSPVETERMLYLPLIRAFNATPASPMRLPRKRKQRIYYRLMAAREHVSSAIAGALNWLAELYRLRETGHGMDGDPGFAPAALAAGA